MCPRGVLESYVIIARVTSLVAVYSEKSKCKVSKGTKRILARKGGQNVRKV